MMNSKINLSIFVWNCQGCASLKFPRIFREYNMEFRPDIIGLLEPKLSGSKADEIIVKLGFHHSHRIEATGFSREIWIGWKETIHLEIIQNHPQFILVKIHNGEQYNPSYLLSYMEAPIPLKERIYGKH